jgi:hypothetical protein
MISASLTTLCARRDKYFSLRDRGMITDTEVSSAFIELLTDAADDKSALSLCTGLPVWFEKVLSESLEDMSKTKFYRRSFGIGDSRTPEEVHRDALRQQELLLRIVPGIRGILQSTDG